MLLVARAQVMHQQQGLQTCFKAGRKTFSNAFCSTEYSKTSVHVPASLPKAQKAARSHLPETLLSCPHRCVDDLQEELSGPRVEDENGSIDRFCGQIPFKSLRKYEVESTVR